ncbi:hypothetical protein D9M68_677500 [compost metagenome]
MLCALLPVYPITSVGSLMFVLPLLKLLASSPLARSTGLDSLTLIDSSIGRTGDSRREPPTFVLSAITPTLMLPAL